MKKIKLPLPLQFFLAALGIELLRSFLIPLAWLLDQLGNFFAYPIFVLSETAGLFLFFATIGVAFAAAPLSLRRAVGLLFLEVAAYFLGGFASLCWQALFFGQGLDAETLTLLVGSAVDSSILPLFLAFFLGYGFFLSKDPKSKPKGYHDLTAAPVRATVLAAGFLFLYRLIGKILEVVDFVNSFTFLNTGETVAMVMDFVLVTPWIFDGGLVRIAAIHCAKPLSWYFSCGVMTGQTSEFLRKEMENTASSAPLLLAGHFPVITDHPWLDFRRKLYHAEIAAEGLENGKIALSMCGHIHQGYERTLPSGSMELCAGSLTKHGSYLEITYDPEEKSGSGFCVTRHFVD